MIKLTVLKTGLPVWVVTGSIAYVQALNVGAGVGLNGGDFLVVTESAQEINSRLAGVI